MGPRRLQLPARVGLSLLSMAILACGSTAAPLRNGAGGGGGGAAGGGASGSGGTSDVAPPNVDGKAVAPGSPSYDLTQPGQGACTSTSLAQAIAAVHLRWPELADIKDLYSNDPNRPGDGSFIYAFGRETGFALAFKRGGGDCPAGCTENEYWYFETGAACAPMQVGHFSAAWGTGNCLITSDTPMWGLPQAPDPSVVCGADNGPRNVSGTYNLRGTGTRVACTEKAGSEPQVSVAVPLTLSITQSSGDLSRGSITLTGTGHPLIDGQAIAATFTRQRFTATREVSNLPATCLDLHSLQVQVDFESAFAGRLQFSETRSLNCPPSQDYCKGQLDLDLVITP